MFSERIKLGQAGEQLAVDFLKRQGYRILHRNYKTALGEIDIIAQDGDTLCFIEVKTRTSDEKGTPWEAITKPKQRKLSQLALSFLKHEKCLDQSARFDIVAVTQDSQAQDGVELLKDAFDLCSPYAY